MRHHMTTLRCRQTFTMTDTRDLFFDKELRTGGFYELSIQVCPSADNEPIKLYTDFIWKLKNVEGPFDNDFKTISADIQNIEHKGILHLDDYAIPFMTYNIREDEPIETGFNWFDICFYTAAIEKVFGSEYLTWTENPKVPAQLNNFFTTTIKKLYEIYPFQLAIRDFEVSGQYYLENLSTELDNEWLVSKFYVGQENYNKVSEPNKTFVTKIEDIN